MPCRQPVYNVSRQSSPPFRLRPPCPRKPTGDGGALLCGCGTMKVNCSHCGMIVDRKPNYVRRYKRHFCSRECQSALAKKQSWKIVVCEGCGKEFSKHNDQIKFYPHHYCSRRCYTGSLSGQSNPNWRDGNCEARVRERLNSRDHRDKAWSLEVRRRAGFRCERCGSAKRPEAHHIKPIEDFPDGRYDPLNGLCLCHACHMKEHIKMGWFRGSKRGSTPVARTW